MSTTYGKGKYRVEIIDQGFGESEAKGTPYFFLQVKVLARLGKDGQEEECPQYERSCRQYFKNETGVNILKGCLKSLGVEVADLTQLDLESPNAISLVGRRIELDCEIEPYEGRPSEKWSVPRSRRKMGPAGVRALQDQFGHLLRNGNTQATPSPAVPTPNDSDAPF